MPSEAVAEQDSFSTEASSIAKATRGGSCSATQQWSQVLIKEDKAALSAVFIFANARQAGNPAWTCGYRSAVELFARICRSCFPRIR